MKIFLFSSLAKDPFFFSVIFFSWARQFTPRKRTGQKSKKILTIRSISPKRGKKKLLQIKRWRISPTFAKSSTFSQLFNQHLRKEWKTLINSDYQHNLSSIFEFRQCSPSKEERTKKPNFKKKKRKPRRNRSKWEFVRIFSTRKSHFNT